MSENWENNRYMIKRSIVPSEEFFLLLLLLLLLRAREGKKRKKRKGMKTSEEREREEGCGGVALRAPRRPFRSVPSHPLFVLSSVLSSLLARFSSLCPSRLSATVRHLSVPPLPPGRQGTRAEGPCRTRSRFALRGREIHRVWAVSGWAAGRGQVGGK